MSGQRLTIPYHYDVSSSPLNEIQINVMKRFFQICMNGIELIVSSSEDPNQTRHLKKSS